MPMARLQIPTRVRNALANRALTVDEIRQICCLPSGDLAAMLMQAERAGELRQTRGRYELVRHFTSMGDSPKSEDADAVVDRLYREATPQPAGHRIPLPAAAVSTLPADISISEEPEAMEERANLDRKAPTPKTARAPADLFIQPQRELRAHRDDNGVLLSQDGTQMLLSDQQMEVLIGWYQPLRGRAAA